MKLVSVSGLVCYVENVAVTTEFYKKIGFIIASEEDGMVTVRLNWFWINFISKEKREYKAGLGSPGQFIYITVDDVDETYKVLKSKGVQFLTSPKTYPSGKREAMAQDPDGYLLVFFQKAK